MGFFDKFGSALIQAGGGLLSGLTGIASTSSANKANLQAVRETNAANRELARYNWEQQVDMWNRNNEYNSPIQQMQRLKEAGLNPNLVYGSGVTGNSSSSIPTPQMPTQEAPHFEKYDTSFIAQASDSALRAYQQQRQLDSQIDLQKSQQSAIQSQNLVNNAKVAEIAARTARSKFDLDYAKDVRQYNLEAAMLNTQQIHKNLLKSDEELKNFPIQRQLMMGQLALLEANRDLSVIEAEKKSYEIWRITGEVANLAAQTRLTNARADVESDPNYQQNLKARLYGEAIKAIASGQTQRLERNWRKRYGWTGNFNSVTSAALEGARGLEFYNNHSSYAE